MGNCLCWGTRVKAESPLHALHSSNKSDEKHSRKKRENASMVKQQSSENKNNKDRLPLRPFTFNELRAATRNFRPDSLLGEGGFGCVFKGWVDEQGFMAARPGTGIVIAVKKLNLEGLQGHKEWLAEVHFLGQLHHPNLVRLIGYCAEDDHRLLVYEFMPRGSLENHLFRRGSHTQALSWAIRIKVAVGAARGLAFLHEAERPVIFRDFKTSNILLNSQFNAKLSDFGLAKDGPTGDNTHVSTRVMGTYGYAAPEYVATGHLTAKSDVYSFGVVLLEILTGRRAVDKNKPIGEQNLVEWARPYLTDKRKVFRIIDPRLEGQYSMKGAYKASTLALSCLNQDAKLRPTMKEVVQLLEPLLSLREITKYSQTPSSCHQNSLQIQYNNATMRYRNGVPGRHEQQQHMYFRKLHQNNSFKHDMQDLVPEQNGKQAPAPKQNAKQDPSPEQNAKQDSALEQNAKQDPAPEQNAKQDSALEQNAKQDPAPEQNAKQDPAPDQAASEQNVAQQDNNTQTI